jgi:HK97 family phage prohead protease
MQHFICQFEIKASADSTRTFSGYGAVTGDIDSYGDVIAKGAFKDTVAKAMAGVTPWPAMLSQHGGPTATDQTPIGVWLSMEEDDQGLKMVGQLANTSRGRDIYQLMKMSPRPAIDGLSIGYVAKDYELHKNNSGPNGARRTLKTIDLKECSLVVFPANSKARVLSVKRAIGPPPAEPYTLQDQARDDWAMLCRTMNANNRDWR